MTNRPRHRTRPGRKPDLSTLRRLGCTCTPLVHKLPPDEWPVGLSHGEVLLHEVGCPFGDRMHQENLLGRIPLIVEMPRPNKRRTSGGGR